MQNLLYKIIIVVLLYIPNNLLAQWVLLHNDADSLTHECLNYIYNLKETEATQCINKIIKLYPKHPVGYFLDALKVWWNITLYKETDEFDEIFINKIDKVVDICDDLLDENKFNIVGLFFKGGAIGYKGRLYTVRENYLKAASAGYDAQDILNQCLILAPTNYDIMLGTGIYNYFVDIIKRDYPLLTPLLESIYPGNKEVGLLQLRVAARRSTYSSVEAKVVLLQVYYEYEKNTALALEIAKELNTMYPDNPYFLKYIGRCQVRNFDIEAWDKTWRKIFKCFQQRKAGYENYAAREALYYIGLGQFYKGNNKLALKYFKKSIEASYVIDNIASGFLIKAILKCGNLYDILGKRDEAKKMYRSLLDIRDFDNSRHDAKIYLIKPYGK